MTRLKRKVLIYIGTIAILSTIEYNRQSVSVLTVHQLSTHKNTSQNQRQHHDVPTQFTTKFEETLDLPAPYYWRDVAANIITNEDGQFVPLILLNGKIMCLPNHKKKLRRMRSRSFIEMLQKGLSLNTVQDATISSYDSDGGFPILLMEGDVMGCNICNHTDKLDFPRLTWATPNTQKHSSKEWCNAIGMTSYESWDSLHKDHVYAETWDATFAKNEEMYPWEAKIKRAVWRGTTTHEYYQFQDSEFRDIPRQKLVQQSMLHPDVIDAAFTAIIQKFEKDKEVLAAQTIVEGRMPFENFMKYKAIIDIDGNCWSSRFAKLLCTNSVVIRIDPDYAEYFDDDLIPGVHYLSASLDNITTVAEYAVDEKNDRQIKHIVSNANSWCKNTLTEVEMANDALVQLKKYAKALDAYSKDLRDEWRIVIQRFSNTLVECSY